MPTPVTEKQQEAQAAYVAATTFSSTAIGLASNYLKLGKATGVVGLAASVAFD